MNYELAKELKDSGFPQHSMCERCPNMEYCIPTLSELIAACVGNDLDFQLVNTTLTEHWNATNRMKTGNGNTPEIAVANLWLALNAK